MKATAEKPLQVRVQAAIRDLIRAQGLVAGDQLPTEGELTSLLDVGRSTLREAMANLESQGLLQRIQGKGTFIRQIPLVLENGIDELRSVSEHIRAVGATPSTSRIEIQVIEASDLLAEKLQVEEGAPLVRIERVRRADGAIAAFCIDILPKSLVPGIESEDFRGSLFEMFSGGGNNPSYAESNLRPTILTRRDFPEMKSEIGLFLLFEEVFYDDNGTPICYSNDYYSADIFDFRIVRKR